MSCVSYEDAETAVRVLQHIVANGLASIPGSHAAKISCLAKDISSGRAFQPKSLPQQTHRCYICRRLRAYPIHPDAPPLCSECATFNTARRMDISTPNMFAGRIALVTGGRINLGYAVALALLRGGASNVMITTRFPDDAVRRYTTEVDYQLWSSRLQIVQADFTSSISIQRAISAIRSLANGRIDILINNAAQTVPIPAPERDRLLSGELELVQPVEHHLASIDTSLVTVAGPSINSWIAKYNEFPYKELLDVLAVNSVAPFILIRECIDLMQHPEPTHIVNVSSREGMFEVQGNKRSGNHVHTNMAKAALNMMTQTLGDEFKRHQVYINAVDPGYLSHQHSLTHNGTDGTIESNVPLTWDDGAARVLNPCIRDPPISGAFFKDYRDREWINGYM